MSNFIIYKPLFDLSAAISECNQELQGEPGRKRKSELKKAIQNMEEKLSNEICELINRNLDSSSSEQPLSEFLAADLDTVKEAVNNSWHLAIDDVKARLLEQANKESRKSPLRRKIEKNGWWIIILAIIVITVSLKWYWLVDINKSLDEPVGVIQRASALEKLIDYDDSMDTRVRRGGFFKSIFLWPAEPTEEEIKYASEFLWISVDVYDLLREQGIVCGANLSHNSNDEKYKDEIAIAQVVIDYINNTPNAVDAESGTLLLMDAYIAKFPCQ